MHFTLVALCLLAGTALSAPPRPVYYSGQNGPVSRPSAPSAGGFIEHDDSHEDDHDHNVGGHSGYGGGQQVREQLYIFDAPPRKYAPAPRPIIPKSKTIRKTIIVRTPETGGSRDPIVVQGNQEQTVVYVLTKDLPGGQQVVEIAERPSSEPEVYYVNYRDGDNPVLPNGLTLNDALSSTGSRPGTVFEDSGSSGAGAHLGGGGGGGNGGGGNGGYDIRAPAAPLSHGFSSDYSHEDEGDDDHFGVPLPSPADYDDSHEEFISISHSSAHAHAPVQAPAPSSQYIGPVHDDDDSHEHGPISFAAQGPVSIGYRG